MTIAEALTLVDEGGEDGLLAIHGAIEGAVLDLLDDAPEPAVEAA